MSWPQPGEGSSSNGNHTGLDVCLQLRNDLTLHLLVCFNRSRVQKQGLSVSNNRLSYGYGGLSQWIQTYPVRHRRRFQTAVAETAKFKRLRRQFMKTLSRWILPILLTGWFLAGGSGASFGQSVSSGDIRGTVEDTSGALVPGVTVSVLNVETGISKDFVTNQDGLY